MKRFFVATAIVLHILTFAPNSAAQTFTRDDPVLRHIWEEGMENSLAYQHSQTLFDSIGPRLTGSLGHKRGNDWLVAVYRSLGISAHNEQYGTWERWQRGRTHIDLVEPRVRTLEGTMLSWSPGTNGETVRGSVILLPEVNDSDEFESWLLDVRGKFVAISFAEPTCRPDDQWERFTAFEPERGGSSSSPYPRDTGSESLERMRGARAEARAAWTERIASAGFDANSRGFQAQLASRLEEAGAVGILTSRWSGGWGTSKITSAYTDAVPTLSLGCEDYGLVARLAEHNQGPVLEVNAEAEFQGEVPVYNTIAEIRGTDLPEEYVVLSAHFDSWDTGSGAVDNGAGTITILEALRILKATYPNPKRTILAGHWSSEEQGLNGSRAFAADHPEIVEGMQALFNQDNGAGRIINISSQGFTAAAGHFGRWLSHVPIEITRHIKFTFPGNPVRGSDHAAFTCHGAPAFRLGALDWNYRTYLWHTDRDTFDKLVFDDLNNNATLMAMLAYLASEDPNRTPRDRRTVFPVDPRTGVVASWPVCQPARTWEDYKGR